MTTTQPVEHPCPSKACGRPVRTVLTDTGNEVLVDPVPHELGRLVPVDATGHRFRWLRDHELPAEQATWRPHTQTCLADPRNRRRAWEQAPAPVVDQGPPCKACGQPTDGALARLGETTHPNCQPVPAPRPAAEQGLATMGETLL